MTFRNTIGPTNVEVNITGPSTIGTAFPSDPIDGQMFLHTTFRALYVYSAGEGGWVHVGPFGSPVDPSRFVSVYQGGVPPLPVTEIGATTCVKTGGQLHVNFRLQLTAPASAGAINISPPFVPFTGHGTIMGPGYILDASAGTRHFGFWVWNDSEIRAHLALQQGLAGQVGSSFPFTLDTGDRVAGTLTYPVNPVNWA